VTHSPSNVILRAAKDLLLTAQDATETSDTLEAIVVRIESATVVEASTVIIITIKAAV
jgi:hypothetical protein